ncbi:MAG: Arm DNA-binding domain-containing protein [Lactobacillus sp.]|uniref:Arm DNA-binding domain-containing protein n=1 Tax=Bombilactobacillus bombi TaxID=1303590 RepID=UPI0035EFF214|nr:Arm DNA-binding domain-containing protein [Lactobacillus sp.]
MFEYKRNIAIKEYVTKKGEKKYWFQIYIGTDSTTGKKKLTTRRGFKTPALANKEYRKIEAEIANNTFKTKNTAKNTSPTFTDVYHQWFDNSYKDTVQSSTIYKTKQIFNCHILPKIGNDKITAITSEYLQPIVNDWANKYSKLNINSRYANRVFKYAYTTKIIESNPFEHVLLPKRNTL